MSIFAQYSVECVDGSSGETVCRTYRAGSAEEAIQLALADGWFVGRVELLPDSESNRVTRRRLASMLAGAVAVIALVSAIVLGPPLYDQMSMQRGVSRALQVDYRNAGIDMTVSFSSLLDRSNLTISLRGVSPTNSPADVFRVLLQTADALQDRSFKSVTLAYRGESRFVLEGDYFQLLGEEYGLQNPVYTMRTFPENLYRPDGTRAFGTWTGGLLGVVTEQIEDFSSFHNEWYGAGSP